MLRQKIISLLEKFIRYLGQCDFHKSFGSTEVLHLGQQASQLLVFDTEKNRWIWRNRALEAAFDKIEEGFIRAWKTSTPKDSEAREHLYYRMEGLAEVKLKLQGMLNAMIFEANKRKKDKELAT